MSGNITCGFRVYMDKSDLSPWVTSVEIDVSRDSIAKEFSVTFSGWSSVVDGASWDIFGSYDPATTPRAEAEIRNGVVPPDRTEAIRLTRGRATFTVNGYSYGWLVQRRRPSRTIVMVPAKGPRAIASAKEAIRRHDSPVGLLTHWTGVRTMHQAVKRLGQAAGIHVDIRIPDYPMQPYVLGLDDTYWSAIGKLVDPFRPMVYYDESNNRLTILDPTASLMGAGSPINLPASIIPSMDVRPDKRRRPSRVIVQVRSWH